MNTVLQRNCARYIYAIPDGLRELMNDISREVLRSQPLNVYTFIADYLDALLITRENARVAVRLVEVLTELSSTTAAFLLETGISREKIDNIVKLVQDSLQECLTSEEDLSKPPQKIAEETQAVKEIMEKIDVPPEMADIAAAIIQQAYKKFKTRKDRERRILSNIVDWRIAARTAITLYRNTGVSNEEANRAATLIKAAYKGYYSRRLLKTKFQQCSSDSENLPDYLLFDEGAEDENDVISNEDAASEKPKSVKIDYNTVKPHVDFDSKADLTDVNNAQLTDVSNDQISTTSDVVRHSLGLILDAAEDQLLERRKYRKI